MTNITFGFYLKDIFLENKRSAYLLLHLAVLLFGFTAILGNIILMPALLIVWWRVIITSGSLLFLVNLKKELKALTRKGIILFVFLGILICIHWICFYGSIKLANSSIALICMSTVALFTSFLEPLLTGKKIDKLEVVLGLLIVPGMIIVAQNVDAEHTLGILAGLAAALLASAFSILNKKHIHRAGPYMINFLEMSGAALFLTILVPILFVAGYVDSLLPTRAIDWFWLGILAIVCTTFTNVFVLKSLKQLSAFASNLVFNFEPLYGIILAAVILKEYQQLNTQFYIGGGLIVAVVFLYPYLKEKLS